MNHTSVSAVIDSTSAYIGLPDDLYFNLIPDVIGGLSSCAYNSNTQQYQCTREKECNWLPDLEINLRDEEGKSIWYQFKSEDYTLPLDSGCKILLKRDTRVSFGLPFLKRFYTVFDTQSAKLQLTSLSRVYHNGKDTEAQVIWWISVVIFVGLMIHVVYKRIRSNSVDIIQSDMDSGSSNSEIDLPTTSSNYTEL